MLVRDRMSSPAITITPEKSHPDAKGLMAQCEIRRLVVVDHEERLLGIVSERDVLHAAPSHATTLSIWELNHLLRSLRVGDFMSRGVITARPEMPIEEAAALMVEHKIGGLPVIDETRRVVGVITETDIFNSFVELFGGDRAGLRLEIEAPERESVLLEVVGTIYGLGGTILSVGSVPARRADHLRIFVKLRGIEAPALVRALETLGEQVIDVRQM